MLTGTKTQGLVIVGAGPAGLAPLFAAIDAGTFEALLNSGITILERSETLGPGALGSYSIPSDSSAEALVDIVLRSREPALAALQSHPLTQAVAQFGKGSAPLQAVGQFLQLAATVLCDAVASSRHGHVIRGANAHWLQQTRGGKWRTRFTDARGEEHVVESHSVLLATGAHQPLARLQTELVAGTPLLPTYGAKLIQSGDLFGVGGMADVSRRLQQKAEPRVAIVGGSTSAAAAAVALLNRLPAVRFASGGVTILHRKPLRIFYETVAEAISDGYTEFGPGDVCAITGRVFRLSGFRLDSRELIMRARGIAGRPPEPRLQILMLDQSRQQEARECLDHADLVIAALGYRPRLLPVLDSGMQKIPVLVPGPQQWAVVDRDSRLLTAEGRALHGLFALGLAVGPAANAGHGGEIGFRGQVNSLWLWQHTLGENIAAQVLERAQARHIVGHSQTATSFAPSRALAFTSGLTASVAQTAGVA